MKQRNVLPKTFSHKLIFAYILVISIAAFSVMGIITIIAFVSNEDIQHLTAETLEDKSARLDRLCQSLIDITKEIAVNPLVQEKLASMNHSSHSSSLYRSDANDLYTICSGYCNTHKDVSRIYIICGAEDNSSEMTTITSSLRNTVRLSPNDIDAILEKTDTTGKADCFFFDEDPEGLYITRRIRQIENISLSQLGVLIIRFDLNQFFTDITDSNLGYVLVNSNQVVYAKPGISSDDVEKLVLPPKDSNQYRFARINNRQYLITQRYIHCIHLFQFTGHLDDEPLMLVVHVPVGTDQLGLSTVQACVASGREEEL